MENPIVEQLTSQQIEHAVQLAKLFSDRIAAAPPELLPLIASLVKYMIPKDRSTVLTSIFNEAEQPVKRQCTTSESLGILGH